MCSLNETTREKIIKILRDSKEPLTVYEIAIRLGLDVKGCERIIYDHLKHIAKSIWRSSKGKYALFMLPPVCRNCGYVFKDLKEPRKPSKCLRCKSQRIEPPRFKIMEYK